MTVQTALGCQDVRDLGRNSQQRLEQMEQARRTIGLQPCHLARVPGHRSAARRNTSMRQAMLTRRTMNRQVQPKVGLSGLVRPARTAEAFLCRQPTMEGDSQTMRTSIKTRTTSRKLLPVCRRGETSVRVSRVQTRSRLGLPARQTYLLEADWGPCQSHPAQRWQPCEGARHPNRGTMISSHSPEFQIRRRTSPSASWMQTIYLVRQREAEWKVSESAVGGHGNSADEAAQRDMNEADCRGRRTRE